MTEFYLLFSQNHYFKNLKHRFQPAFQLDVIIIYNNNTKKKICYSLQPLNIA